MPKHSSKAERKKNARYVMIEDWEFKSPAIAALTGDEFKIYFFLRSRYNGRNNGQIMFSVRQAGEVINKSHHSGRRALERLEKLGFIKIRLESTFGQKRICREFELTALGLKPAESKKRLPTGTKDFMHWTARQLMAMKAREKEQLKIKARRTDASYRRVDDLGGDETPSLRVVS